jgi:hypothetical protein
MGLLGHRNISILVNNTARYYVISNYLFTWIQMLINCSKRERGSVSSSSWVSLYGGTMCVGWRWKGTTTTSEASMVWCSSQGGDKIETQLSGGESDQGWGDLFIAVEGGSQAVQGGWLAAAVQIQCFDFSSKWEVTGRSVARRWSRSSKLILIP